MIEGSGCSNRQPRAVDAGQLSILLCLTAWLERQVRIEVNPHRFQLGRSGCLLSGGGVGHEACCYWLEGWISPVLLIRILFGSFTLPPILARSLVQQAQKFPILYCHRMSTGKTKLHFKSRLLGVQWLGIFAERLIIWILVKTRIATLDTDWPNP